MGQTPRSGFYTCCGRRRSLEHADECMAGALEALVELAKQGGSDYVALGEAHAWHEAIVEAGGDVRRHEEGRLQRAAGSNEGTIRCSHIATIVVSGVTVAAFSAPFDLSVYCR